MWRLGTSACPRHGCFCKLVPLLSKWPLLPQAEAPLNKCVGGKRGMCGAGAPAGPSVPSWRSRELGHGAGAERELHRAGEVLGSPFSGGPPQSCPSSWKARKGRCPEPVRSPQTPQLAIWEAAGWAARPGKPTRALARLVPAPARGAPASVRAAPGHAGRAAPPGGGALGGRGATPRPATARSEPWRAPRAARGMRPPAEGRRVAGARGVCVGETLDALSAPRTPPPRSPPVPAERPPLTQRCGDTDCAGKEGGAAAARGGRGGRRAGGGRGAGPARDTPRGALGAPPPRPRPVAKPRPLGRRPAPSLRAAAKPRPCRVSTPPSRLRTGSRPRPQKSRPALSPQTLREAKPHAGWVGVPARPLASDPA